MKENSLPVHEHEVVHHEHVHPPPLEGIVNFVAGEEPLGSTVCPQCGHIQRVGATGEEKR